MKNITKIAIVVIVAVLVLVVIAAATSSPSDQEKGHEAYYNFELDTKTSFTSPEGYVETPPSGQKYVIAKVSLKNASAKNGVSDNPLYFVLDINGIQHSYDWDTYSYPGYHSPVSYTPGTQGYNYFVYVVPTSTSLSNAKIAFDGFPWEDVVYDPSKF